MTGSRSELLEVLMVCGGEVVLNGDFLSTLGVYEAVSQT